jgi:hypothetical protein
VDFPAARLLARAEQESSARLRLRNWLLMALRVLALVLVAARGGPAARRAARDDRRCGGRGSRRRQLAQCGRGHRRSAHDRATARRPGAPRSTRRARRIVVWLVTVDGAVVGGSRDAVRAALDRLTLWPGRAICPRR